MTAVQFYTTVIAPVSALGIGWLTAVLCIRAAHREDRQGMELL